MFRNAKLFFTAKKSLVLIMLVLVQRSEPLPHTSKDKHHQDNNVIFQAGHVLDAVFS